MLSSFLSHIIDLAGDKYAYTVLGYCVHDQYVNDVSIREQRILRVGTFLSHFVSKQAAFVEGTHSIAQSDRASRNTWT